MEFSSDLITLALGGVSTWMMGGAKTREKCSQMFVADRLGLDARTFSMPMRNTPARHDSQLYQRAVH